MDCPRLAALDRDRRLACCERYRFVSGIRALLDLCRKLAGNRRSVQLCFFDRDREFRIRIPVLDNLFDHQIACFHGVEERNGQTVVRNRRLCFTANRFFAGSDLVRRGIQRSRIRFRYSDFGNVRENILERNALAVLQLERGLSLRIQRVLVIVGVVYLSVRHARECDRKLELGIQRDRRAVTDRLADRHRRLLDVRNQIARRRDLLRVSVRQRYGFGRLVCNDLVVLVRAVIRAADRAVLRHCDRPRAGRQQIIVGRLRLLKRVFTRSQPGQRQFTVRRRSQLGRRCVIDVIVLYVIYAAAADKCDRFRRRRIRVRARKQLELRTRQRRYRLVCRIVRIVHLDNAELVALLVVFRFEPRRSLAVQFDRQHAIVVLNAVRIEFLREGVFDLAVLAARCLQVERSHRPLVSRNPRQVCFHLHKRSVDLCAVSRDRENGIVSAHRHDEFARQYRFLTHLAGDRELQRRCRFPDHIRPGLFQHALDTVEARVVVRHRQRGRLHFVLARQFDRRIQLRAAQEARVARKIQPASADLRVQLHIIRFAAVDVRRLLEVLRQDRYRQLCKRQFASFMSDPNVSGCRIREDHLIPARLDIVEPVCALFVGDHRRDLIAEHVIRMYERAVRILNGLTAVIRLADLYLDLLQVCVRAAGRVPAVLVHIHERKAGNNTLNNGYSLAQGLQQGFLIFSYQSSKRVLVLVTAGLSALAVIDDTVLVRTADLDLYANVGAVYHLREVRKQQLADILALQLRDTHCRQIVTNRAICAVKRVGRHVRTAFQLIKERFLCSRDRFLCRICRRCLRIRSERQISSADEALIAACCSVTLEAEFDGLNYVAAFEIRAATVAVVRQYIRQVDFLDRCCRCVVVHQLVTEVFAYLRQARILLSVLVRERQSILIYALLGRLFHLDRERVGVRHGAQSVELVVRCIDRRLRRQRCVVPDVLTLSAVVADECAVIDLRQRFVQRRDVGLQNDIACACLRIDHVFADLPGQLTFRKRRYVVALTVFVRCVIEADASFPVCQELREVEPHRDRRRDRSVVDRGDRARWEHLGRRLEVHNALALRQIVFRLHRVRLHADHVGTRQRDRAVQRVDQY